MLDNGLAPMPAALAGSELLLFTSWKGVFVARTVYGLVLVPGVALVLPETLPPERRRRGGLRDTLRTFGKLSRDRLFVAYALGGGLVFAAMFAYISGSPFVTQEVYGVSKQTFGLIFGVNALGIVLFSQLNGWLLGRFSPSALLSAALLLNLVGGLGVLAAVASGSHPRRWLLPPPFLVVASVGVGGPNTTALALAGHPETARSASPLLGLGQVVFGAGPPPPVRL